MTGRRARRTDLRLVPVAAVAWAVAALTTALPGTAVAVAAIGGTVTVVALLVAARAARGGAGTASRTDATHESDGRPHGAASRAAMARALGPRVALPTPDATAPPADPVHGRMEEARPEPQQGAGQARGTPASHTRHRAPRRRIEHWQGLAALVAVAAAVGVGVALHVAAAAPARDAVAALPVDGGRSLRLEAVVVGKVEPGAVGIRFDAHLEQVAVGSAVQAVSAPIVVRADARVDGLDVGARVALEGTAFRADAGARAVLVVDASTLSVRAPPQGVLAAAAGLRGGLHEVVRGLPEPGAGLVPGLAVGDTAGVSAELDAAMKASSLSHLTAVSGANCALVVGIAFAAAALCGARRWVRVTLALAVLAGFVVLVTPEPSVVRAAVMAAIGMLGLVLGRIGAGVSLLTAAVTGILLLDPWLCTSLGFALSAAATAALLLLAGPLADGLSRWMPGPVALAVAVPLAAQLACGPLLILIAPTVPLQGVLANILAGPAAPAATVLGLAACLLAGVPVLGAGLAGLAWLPAAWIAGTAEVLSGIPAVPWPDGPLGAALLAVVGGAVAVTVVAVRGRLRAASVVVVCAAAGIIAGAGPGLGLVERATTPGEWTVVACEVGQGDAVLLRSAGRIMLVDTGPDPEPLGACLDRWAVGRIDVLVLTHFDADHRGGIAAVTGRVDLLVHGPTDDAADAALVDELVAGGARAVAVTTGMTGVLGEATWRVLWPRTRAEPGNDASVVVDVSGGGLPSTLLLGDLSASPQQSILASGALRGRYDVVKVAHHGSADQSPDLYRATRPGIALVTVGENDYGHPRASILETLATVGAFTARTDRGGDAALWLDGDVLRVWRRRPDEAAGDVAPGG
ncbi:ComEC/Rec2 family competence protein [Microbacterium sp. W1N]|uniref:ComEC/Rec2 family competence protein n=1 Tax=Microbacterium festucae TaxID=2977531 RepID=UPI0021C03DB2|nr:ComEC/Rec2 family competence protein [Microbacterium festucae]MCT9820154.1 ComEC/Rec2 family competence protein [Microbacterium festucae]